ncbi:MAG: class I SAM-dependent methyltransferase [Candidatus Bipolaricaulota bacterium]
MIRERVIETVEGIQGAFDAEAYDRWMKSMRKRGWIETRAILAAGIVSGHALEISPGPGYLGLDWLSKTQGTTLTGLDLSEEMLKRCRGNAAAEGLAARASYVHGDACSMPFGDGTFDAVFANGGLHEWADPVAVFDEVGRVLRPGGAFCVTDLRRDMNAALRVLLRTMTGSRSMRAGFDSSVRAAYVPEEVRTILARSRLSGARVDANAIGIEIIGAMPLRVGELVVGMESS